MLGVVEVISTKFLSSQQVDVNGQLHAPAV
jgi:hypothetical protein